MRSGCVTVFGGTGFIGRRIVERLAGGYVEIRVAVRHPERAEALEHAARIVAIRADVWEEATVGPAVEGADAVVNTVGHYVERGGASFDAIHGQGARHVAAAAALAGVRRLVHVSGLGADAASSSAYVRARAIGERLVVDAFPDATILRPGVVFGSGGGLLLRLASLARTLPAIPLFGTGSVRLQPVYVGDVAAAVAAALARDDARGRTYELGGPRVYSYRALLQLIMQRTGRRRPLVPVPYFAWHILASLLAPLPSRPVSRDQVTLMREDNVVGDHALTLGDLGITPTPLETALPDF